MQECPYNLPTSTVFKEGLTVEVCAGNSKFLWWKAIQGSAVIVGFEINRQDQK